MLIAFKPLIRLLLPFVAMLPFIASAGSPMKIIVIDSQKGEPYRSVREATFNELSRRGYNEASGFTHEYSSLSHYHGAAKNLWKHKIQKGDYDLIFLTGTLAVESFKKIAWQSEKHKFVFAAVTDPVGLGVIDGFGMPPPSNFTGVGFLPPVEARMNFIRELMPDVKHIGMVHADMPQAHSHRKWIEEILKTDEWKGVTLHHRQVSFIPSEGGHRRMTQMAKQYIQELDPVVDIFIAPTDQMGAQSPYAKMVYSTASKPLIGIGENDVTDGWGTTASIYSVKQGLGVQLAGVIERVLTGETIAEIIPEEAKKYGIVIDGQKAQKYGIQISEELAEKASIINP